MGHQTRRGALIRPGATAPLSPRHRLADGHEVRRLQRRSADQRTVDLRLREQFGRTMLWGEQLEARIQALTPEQINAAFRRLVDPAALSIVKAGTFR